MKNDLIFKRTSLSTSDDVDNTLNYKLQSLLSDNLPVQEGIADYIALSLDEISMQRLQLKAVKAEATERDKVLAEQERYVKEESAKFLIGQGADKLIGTVVSSITVSKGKKESTKKKFTLLVDKKESERYLIEAGLAVMEEVEVPATKATIRVNKRKTGTTTVETQA